MVGYFEGGYRMGVNYKNQWRSFTVPYRTGDAYFDMKWHHHALNKNDWFGLGINAMYDEAGDGVLTDTRINTGFSYHKSMNEFQTVYVSIGFMAGLGQRSIDMEKLYFGNQWIGTGFDPMASSNENISGETFLNFDMGTGLNLSFKLGQKWYVNIGGSLLHLNKPDDNFYNSNVLKPIKPIFHVNGLYSLSYKIELEPAFFYTKQNNGEEMVLGTNVAFNFGKDKIYLGSWYRFTGDFIPVIGFTFFNFRVLASYDYNFSALQPATNYKGSYEISVVYTLGDPYFSKESSKKNGFRCPSF